MHCYYESPIGTLEIRTKHKALVGLKFITKKTKNIEQQTPFQQKVCRQLNDYFFYNLKTFNIEIELEGTDFQKRIWNYLETIPYGTTVSYQSVANALNIPSSTIVIGKSIGKNPILIVIPCHRVIGIDGALKGYSGGLHRKAKLLELENKKYFCSLPLED
ncbi:MAG: methylated-DNA--[protein]-cysteine S-methyltransferase [Flavobacteriaceae bacterium]|nr:methylated-DNA--[protein]-cysteine S-methyltransferase [Flavobacteriaceae bacterium]MCY4266428.1 methylated-DNA--[protein]-cysteine S-methyltransferase [Flavobacteriaceae bacterium]MCY4299186.1 methylated-DNA--[protein]-cysteine S-methyltransferase [Flavobacteriaceae bacterium]